MKRAARRLWRETEAEELFLWIRRRSGWRNIALLVKDGHPIVATLDPHSSGVGSSRLGLPFHARRASALVR